MKKTISLTKVFIKEFYQNLSIFDNQKKKFNKKSVLFWLMTLIFLGITYVSHQVITFLVDAGQPEVFLNLYFLILAIFLLFQVILVCANVFFFSKDIEKVLHMPLKPEQLLMAKYNTLLFMLYVTEGVVGVVPLILYGLLTTAHVTFYFWAIIVLLLFPILFELMISTVMLIIMRFARFIKNKDTFQFIVTTILITVVCILEMQAFSALFKIENDQQIEEGFYNLSQRAEEVGKYLLVINPSVTIMKNPSSVIAIASFIQIVGYNIIALGLFVIIGKITYLKDILKNIVSQSKRKRKNIIVEDKTKIHSKKMSYIIKEFKLLIKQPVFFMQCVFPVMIILISAIALIFILLPIVMEIIHSDETLREALSSLSFNAEAICDILILLQVLFSISNISLTAISRDGKNATLIKYIPIELYKQFHYKNIPQITLNLFVSIVVLGLIWYLIPQINILYLLLLLIVSIFISMINSYLMLIVDLRRPNLDWDTEYSVVKKSDNKFFQYAFMIVNVLFLLYIANLFKEADALLVLGSEIVIFAVIFIILDRCIKKWQKKLFNKII